MNLNYNYPLMKNLPASFLERLHSPGGSRFMSDVYKIVGGTGLAQLLIALGTPVVSRIYSEPTLGISTLFISLSLILSIVASLRYEVAILLPKEEDDAVQLLRISLIATVIVTLFSALGLWAAQDSIPRLLREPALRSYLMLVPVALAGIGVYQALNYWNTRTKNYWRLSAAKIISALITIGLQIGLGFWLHDHPAGLILGFTAGYLAGSLFLGWYIWTNDPGARTAWNWEAMLANLARYRKFPLVDTWGSLVNAVSWQIPPLLLAFFFSSTQTGNYAMAYRLIQLPTSFVGVAIAQVFSQRSANVKEDAQALIQVTRSVLHRLIGLGIFPSFMLSVLGKDLFVIFLGPNWETAGTYVQILGIWMFFWFASWPLGTLANIKDRQDTILILQIFLLLSRIASLAIGGWLGNDLLAIGLFSGSGILVYAAYAIICLRMINYPLRATLPFLAQQTLTAAAVAGALGLAHTIFAIPPLGMVLLGGLVSGLYFLLFMRKMLA